jgi:hypothetical protein
MAGSFSSVSLAVRLHSIQEELFNRSKVSIGGAGKTAGASRLPQTPFTSLIWKGLALHGIQL